MEATKHQNLELTSVFRDDRAEIEDHPMIGEHSMVFRDCDTPETPEWLRELCDKQGRWVLSYCRFDGHQIIRYICADGVDHVELSTVDPINEDNWEEDTDVPEGCTSQKIKDLAYYLR